VKFLKQTIEKKISSLLGTEITFGELNVSPLMGKAEAVNVVIAGDEPGKPLLTIRRMEGKIAIGKLLSGEFEIKSLLVEEPRVFLNRRDDRGFNLPRPAPAAPTAAPEKPKQEWHLEAQSIRVVGGQFVFQHNAYQATAENISGEMKCHAGVTTATLHIRSIGRRDVPVEFGSANVTGELHDEDILTGLADAPIKATWKFVTGLELSINCPALSGRRATVELHGPLDVKLWQAALPERFLPQALTVLNFAGPVNADIKLDISEVEGIHVREMNLRAAR
jgi:uncharacterized protein involved in outer membrane biogenesis